MNYKLLCGWLLVAASGAAAIPLRASGTDMTPQEQEAYRRVYGEPPRKELRIAKSPRPDAVSTRWRPGLEIMLSGPRQDFRDMDSHTGFGGAVFLENELSDSWRVQSRFEYIRYPQSSDASVKDLVPGNGPIQPLTLSATAASLGVDVHYHLPYPGWRRIYLVTGLRAVRYELAYTTTAVRLDPVSPAGAILDNRYHTPVTLGVDVGFGVDFNRYMAMTSRFTYTTVSGVVFATCDLGLSVRF